MPDSNGRTATVSDHDNISSDSSIGDTQVLVENDSYYCQNSFIGCKNNLTSCYYNVTNISQSTENIIALFWGTFILFIGVVFVVAQYTTLLKSHNFVTTYSVLFVLMVLSIIGMSTAVRNRSNRSFIMDVETDAADKVKSVHPTKYLMVSAYILAIGNFLSDMFSIITVFHCGMVGTTTTEKNKYAMKFLYHFVKIVFYSLQLVFLQIFISTKINRNFDLFMKILVVHNIATNVIIWFTNICQESGIFSKPIGSPTGEYYVLNCTSDASDTAFAIARDASNCLDPFIFEYSVLVAAMCYTIYPVKDYELLEDRTRRKYNYGAVDTVKKDDPKMFKSDPGVLFGILIILLMILATWCVQDNAHYLYSLRFAYCMQILMQILTCVASIIILKEVRKYHTKEQPVRKYRIDDYLLMVTGLLGFLPFLFTILFSISNHTNFGSLTDLPTPVVSVLKENVTEVKIFLGFITVINTTSVFIQTFVLLTVPAYKRVEFAIRRRNSSVDIDSLNDNYFKLRSSARIGQWLLFLSILNIGFWVNNSFFELRDSLVRTYATASVYWDPNIWRILTKILYPLLIFYRFHSAAILLRLWLNFRIKRKLF